MKKAIFWFLFVGFTVCVIVCVGFSVNARNNALDKAQVNKFIVYQKTMIFDLCDENADLVEQINKRIGDDRGMVLIRIPPKEFFLLVKEIVKSSNQQSAYGEVLSELNRDRILYKTLLNYLSAGPEMIE